MQIKFKDFISKLFIKYWSIYLFIFILIVQKEINYLFYDIFLTPDLEVYLPYFKYFFNGEIVNREQGILYYYLHALNYKLFYVNNGFLDIFIHKSIQQVNFYIFLFGLIGLYKLFKYYNFKISSIFLTFSFLCLFPPSIASRLAFKPELLAFSLFTWIIFLLEKYKYSKDIKLLIYLVPFLATVFSLKGNVLVIIGLYLLVNYSIYVFRANRKALFIVFLIFISNLTFIYLENNSVTNMNLLDTQSGSTLENKYDYKASPSIIYKTNLFKLFTSPIKHNHANSFIGITLLETTGDYFDLFWDNDASMFFKNRYEIISFEESKKISAPILKSNPFKFVIFQQNLTDVYLYEAIGLLISIYLFFLLFKLLICDQDFIKFYLAIFFGMLILLIHVITGFPKNNFDPLVGDTFKPLYYSFVFVFSFAFVIIRGIELKVIKKYQLLLYGIIIIFLIGFPKIYNYEVQSQIAPKIQASIFCELDKKIFLENSEFVNTNCQIKRSQDIDKVGEENFTHKPVNLINILLILLISFKFVFEKNHTEALNSFSSSKKIKQK